MQKIKAQKVNEVNPSSYTDVKNTVQVALYADSNGQPHVCTQLGAGEQWPSPPFYNGIKLYDGSRSVWSGFDQ